MITVRLLGGLGNQLFQYAFGRSLSHDLNTELFLDLSHYNSKYSKSLKHQFYALQFFNINKNINTEKFSKDMIEKSLPDITQYKEASFNEITEFPSLKNINKLKLPAYFDGYWQSERYFMHNEKIIKNDLHFNIPLNGKNKLIAGDISDHNSVAMHIRRGDYKNYPQFGMCNSDYYKKSVSFIEKHVENPKFFIFSNDHEWVKKNIRIPHPTYHVTHNNVEKGYEDLRLMSLCKHFIIANSSFSWWGAWLSKNENKIVATPQPWFISRDPNLRYITNGKHYFPIINDDSKPFNESKLILFVLDPLNYSLDIPSTHNVNLSVNDDMLNMQSLGIDSKIFLKEVKKLNKNNDVIMKISLKTKSSGVLQMYYTTKEKSEYNENNKFFLHYYKNEDLNIYIRLSKDILLTNLMIIPSSVGESSISIKSLEIREISNSNKFSSILDNSIYKFRKLLPSLK
jgi:hypothetical protein